jgi:prepilin-type N-terminal cleavage/methylation domain-containing protein
MGMTREDGFTLIELLVAILVMSMALGLGAYSIRRYWQTQALHNSVDEVVSELRSQQQEASTATHPWVYGAWFKPDSPRWGVVKANSLTGTCQVVSSNTFGTGVEIESAAFDDIATKNLTANCAAAAESGAEVVIFFARGTATGGTVALDHPEASSGAAKTVRVYPVTGKVERL